MFRKLDPASGFTPADRFRAGKAGLLGRDLDREWGMPESRLVVMGTLKIGVRNTPSSPRDKPLYPLGRLVARRFGVLR